MNIRQDAGASVVPFPVPVPVKEIGNRIFLSAPHMTGNEQKYISEAFDSNWIAPMGANVNQFEAEMAAYATTQAAAALSSGTAAIHLALQLLGIGKGDRVFCSSLTFVASANPILYAGAEPVFIDSEEETWNMSPWALQKAFAAAEQEGKLPKAVVIVHIYGQSARMDELIALCDHYGVPVIEDAAESLGSTYKGKKPAVLGHTVFIHSTAIKSLRPLEAACWCRMTVKVWRRQDFSPPRRKTMPRFMNTAASAIITG